MNINSYNPNLNLESNISVVPNIVHLNSSYQILSKPTNQILSKPTNHIQPSPTTEIYFSLKTYIDLKNLIIPMAPNDISYKNLYISLNIIHKLMILINDLHQKNIFYGEIRPENIMIRLEDFDIKFINLGSTIYNKKDCLNNIQHRHISHNCSNECMDHIDYEPVKQFSDSTINLLIKTNWNRLGIICLKILDKLFLKIEDPIISSQLEKFIVEFLIQIIRYRTNKELIEMGLKLTEGLLKLL